MLILDEPTAVLTPQEWAGLLGIIQRLQSEGKSIIFISHKFGEVLAVSDRITVMRDGRVVGHAVTKETNKDRLARMMVGRPVMLVVQKGPASPGEPVLTVDHVSAKNDRDLLALRDVSLEVRAGEILGVAGVAGNGQTELEEVIAGLREATTGRITVCGKQLAAKANAATVAGLAHVPSDRYGMAMLRDFSIADNLVLQRVADPPFTSRGFLNRTAIHDNAVALIHDFDVRTPSDEAMAGNLSGGNAQKMVLARELSRKPKVLLAAQPTRGLDVAAIEFVHRKLVEQRDAGLGVLLISTELDEILALSDRIAVMYEGEIMGTVEADGVDVKDIGLMMAGQRWAA